MLKQKTVATLAVLIMLGSTVAILPAYATSSNTGGGNFFSGLIQFLSQKFGLDQNTVQSAVTDYKNQIKPTITQNMQNRDKSRLDALVSQGKITSTQETAIITEIAVLRTKYNLANFKGMTADQRKQQFQNEQNEIKSWAQSQEIDPSYVMPFGGMRGGFGFGHKGRGWGRGGVSPSVTPTPTP